MIVTCTSCKTRFRVSGEKVGPKGARLRCARCKTVFVVPAESEGPGAAGGVPEDPSDSLSWPDLEQPPPLPRARANGAPADLEPAAADPFHPADEPSSLDPFAAAGPAPGASPFAAVVSAPPGAVVDPFAFGEPAAPARSSEDPFATGAGWDPFGVAEPVAGGAADAPAVTAPAPPARADLTELLGESAPPRPAVDFGTLALEEHEVPRPKAALPLDEPGLDAPLPDALLGGDRFELPGVPGADDVPPDREPPRVDASTDVAPVPAGAAEPERVAVPPSPRRATPPPAPAVEIGPLPTAEARRGRIAGALTSSLSLVLLVAVAAALFLGWKSGLVARLRGALARAQPAPVVETSAVTGGLYDTAAGSPVLVVRGRVDARTAMSGPVRVRVELLDGARVVATATGLAGAAGDAEQVYAAGTADSAAELRRALDAQAAKSLSAGGSAPFLVVFPPPAPEPRGLRLRVGAEPARRAAPGGG